MTERNGQLAGIIPAEDPTTARHAIDERPTTECEMSLDDANSPVISHALTASSAVALSSTEEKQQPITGIGNITRPSSIASRTPEQPSLQPSQTQNDYWRKALAGAPAMLDLPTDRSRASPRSTDVSTIPIQLDASLTQSLKKVATEYNMDLGMVVMTAWGAVLARLSNQDDIVIGLQHSDLGELEGSKQTDDTSILPLRMDLSGEPDISQLLERVRKMASSMDHQGFPLNGIAEITSTPLFRVAFQWNSQAPLQSFSTSIRLDIELQLREQDSEVLGNMVFSSDLFNPDTIKRHIGYLLATLKTMAKDPTQPVATIDILSPEERRLILETWNETSEVYPDHLCFHQLFEIQVSKTPDATAIVCGDQSLSYNELNCRANRLAHHFIGLGVRPDTRVAICVDRSPGMIIGILAIMKAGGAYVPLDPSYASGRLNDILQDASPAIVVADQTGQAVLEDSALTIVDPNTLLDHPISNPCVPELTSRHLAYIIYTSGSTGKPKGVMVEHLGVSNLPQAQIKLCGYHPTGRVLQFASCGFDVSAWDILISLTSGASLFLSPAIVRQDRSEFWKFMAKHSITLATLTPSFLQDGKDLPVQTKPVTLVLGGEALNRTLLQNLISRGYTVVNNYGPTENTMASILWRCPPDYKEDVVAIGRPICNYRIYLLDSYQQPVPVGVTGEIYIGGVGVARGYLNRPDLTAERFLGDPFVCDRQARMYRTGDLGRYLPDGNIVFLGRNDDQVKIRGFRIEPGEIEARLSEHPLVQKAAVIALGEGEAKRLVAYVVAKPEDQLVHILRTHLVSRLPDYMVPAAIVRMDELPLTSNDKIDRRALPEPDSNAFARQAYEEPQGEPETCLAQLWAELLSIDRVSRNDDFFALGGHSLLAVRMLSRLRRLGLTVSISTVYQSPILNVLAQALEKHQADSISPNLITAQTMKLTPEMLPLINLSQTEIDRIVKHTPGGIANIQDIYSLSPFQDGVLFHHLLTTEGDPYLISTQMAFETRDLLDRYLQAFQEVVNRHDILRTAFVWKDTSTHAQVVWRQASLPIQELTLDPADGPIAKQLDERFHPKHYRIDLTQAPLLRFTLAQDTDGRWILSQLIHHLIGDHVASEIMNHEIEQILHGHVHSLATPHPFRNSIAQARSKSDHEIHRPFFEEMLGDIDEPTFPYGMVEVQNNGVDVTESHSNLPQELNSRLRFQAKQMGVSLASLCHVAWSLVLAHTTGQERVVFGTVLFGGPQNDQEVGPTMGIFINTLPFRCDINSQSVRECVHLAHIRLATLLEHEHASLALAQKCSAVPAGVLLFSALLNYVHTSLPRGNSEKLDMEFTSEEEQVHYPGIEFLGGRERTNYPFGIDVLDYGTDLGLAVQTQQPVDSRRVESYMKQALESLVDALENDPDMAVTKLEILPPDERELLMHGFNTTWQDYPADLCIHHLFEQQVDLNPQATAVVFNGQSLTYAMLNERVNKLAHHLISLGVRPDSLVAICVERSFAMIIGVLGILKAGGAYVPLDPAYASDRLRDILADAAPSIVIADESGRRALGERVLSSLTVVNPDSVVALDKSKSFCTHNPQVQDMTASNLAYVIFTSGSTGKPKGVMIEHRGVVNLAQTHTEFCGIYQDSRVLLFASLNFDASVWDMMLPLSCGASLYLLADSIRQDRDKVWEYMAKHSITHASFTPSFLQDGKSLPIRIAPLTLVLGGEPLGPALLQNLIAQGYTVINDFGPTELTVSASTWRCPSDFKGDIIPIGRPVIHSRIYLLDKRGQPVPLGAIGEMYVGGIGVARGYLNQPELTAKAFLPDPFAEDKDARMYKTGDLARYLPDGNLVYLGRNDHQVKIRGFRIELGEIDARLVEHPLVDEAAVIAIGEGSDKKLVGYVVAKPDDSLVETLRSYLTSCLPGYMVPAAIVRLDSLPLNSNGKLDRKALPVPDRDAYARQVYEEPQGGIETAIAQIWAEVLNIDHVSRNDNFFSLGGHSLLVVRLMNRVASLGVQIPFSTVFSLPTLQAFAESISQHMDKETAAYSTIHFVSREGDLPLSFSQQRMWFLAQMEGVSETYHIPSVVRLRGDLNRDAWQRALDTLFARHEALRSVFVAVDGRPQVRLLPAQSGLPIRWKDLRGSSDAKSELEKMTANEATIPFDLAQGPLIRVLVVQLDTNEHMFMVTQHHIVSDGWSSAIFNRELSTLYSAHCNGEPDPLAPLSIQYPDYAAWQKKWLSGDRLETHTTYWKSALTDAPVLLDLPTDRPRPPQQSYTGDNIPIHLNSDLTSALKQLCQEHGVTLYMAILAAWSCVHSRLSGQDDIVIGSPSANRNHHQIESLIGIFVNTLALRIDLSGGPTVRQLLERVRKTSLDAQNHQDLPFEQVVDIVQPPRNLSHSPLFQVMFVMQNNEESEWHLPGLDIVEANLSYDIAKFDLTLSLFEMDNEILGALSYSTALFDHATVGRHVGYLCSMLQAMVEDADRPVMSVDLLSHAERDLVLGKWNETQQDYPDGLCIHNLFEQQVERTPQATALIFNREPLTYAELNERANRLAHHLLSLGVQPESLVAICVERSIAMIVGAIAILKAGGAYVPLDPASASNRLQVILADAAPGIVVADKLGRQVLGVSALAPLTVVDPDTGLNVDPKQERASGTISLADPFTPNPRIAGLTSNHLAYVIYTSGSTGKPKGVMIEHHGVVNLVMSRPDAYGATPTGNIALFPSFAFDSSVVDMFTTLSFGGSLHVLPDDIRMDRIKLWEYLENQSITQALLPPAILQECKDLQPLETPVALVIAGEALPSTLLRVLHGQIPNGRIINDYGPTEATVSSTTWKCPSGFNGELVPIGRPIANKKIYILDEDRQPVPLGSAGELYIGGVGIARGYLNRPDLTAKAFVPDPFSGDKDARMYKTGDLARYLPDGNIVFLGRNDHQVKIRGFRIELGEIEARLVDHPLVDKAVVITVGEGPDRMLVGYVVAKPDTNLANTLRSHLTSCLPEYMVPAAIVRLDSLPINSNGKLDRKALPAPDSDAFAHQVYEEPHGETETAVARIWADLLHLDRVGRSDNFFALGGHSLLAVQMIERLRRAGHTLAVSALFKTPTLSELVQSLGAHKDCDAPTNLIMPGTTNITPEMLPLITLSQEDIDHIVKCVPGGVSNIQDIYSLSPLQEGILFHHLLATEGDPYLDITLMAFENRELLDKYLGAIQMVVNRHDILRTAVLHENLSIPAQVVWRQAPLSIAELQLDPSNGPIPDQLRQKLDPRQYRIDVTQAPLMSFTIAQDTDGRWILADLYHHLISDHTTLEVMFNETTAFMNDQGYTLPAPQPFRNLIAQAKASQRQDDHEKFFKEMLQDIDTPSLPFGLKDVHGQGDNVTTSYQPLPQDLNSRLRRQAKHLGVSVASLCHLAWAQVISHTSGEDRVVFGTVLFGRMNSGQGSDSAMGLFINTLPLRVDLTGTVYESVFQTHERLALLLDHEHASLTLAQRCSSVPQGAPLFSAMLNYRHNATLSDTTALTEGIEFLESHERNNYPFAMAVEDFGVSLGLTAKVVQPLSPTRVCGYMKQALESLVHALEHASDKHIDELNILPEDEQELLLREWNATQQDYPADLCIHHLFEQQVERTPRATALVFNGQSMTYTELNERANRLAHHLITLDVQPDSLVAICVERSIAMIVGVLAILKAGGAYVPLDPAYASGRLRDILVDASPNIVIADVPGRLVLGDAVSSMMVVDPNELQDTDQRAERTRVEAQPVCNPHVRGLTSSNLAYIIYTSGSTGKPKGVMIEHRGVINLIHGRPESFGITTSSRALLFTSLSFDHSVSEIFSALTAGACLHLVQDEIRLDRSRLWDYFEQHSISHTSITPTLLQDIKDLSPLTTPLTFVIMGETLPSSLIPQVQKVVPNGDIINEYGPTETTVATTIWKCPHNFNGDIVPIGRPIPNKTIYILDKHQQPVLIGAVGELYIGGVGVARGYLNRPELTAKVFLQDPFAEDKDARMYKTGDLARYLPDGNIIFLGRNDHQVKIRGFRIELGEIEARLVDHPLVDKAAVTTIGEGSDKRLVGYAVAKPCDNLLKTLRAHLISCLPGYMVPAAIVQLDSLPINSNGKLDRKALPIPNSDAFSREIYEAPRGDVETSIAHIWAEVLNIDRVSRNDNFFALGGHSLLAVRLMNRVASLGVQMSLSTIFASPTLLLFADSVAQSMDKGSITYSTIHTIPRDGNLPLSFAQQRMWFLSQMEGVSETYHMPKAVRLHGDLNRDAWQRAMDTLFARHESLRSFFVAVDGQPQVRLLPVQSGMQIRWKDLRGSLDTELQLERMCTKEAKDPFDLAQGPLIRVLVVQLDTQDHAFMVTQHHIVSDGWSSSIFIRELSALYIAYCGGEPDPLPPLSIQYPDYAAWQKQWLSGDRLETQAAYWKTALTDVPVVLDLPTDRPRPPQQSFAGADIHIHLDADLTRALKQLCRQHGVTLYMTILAAWGCVLSRLSGQDDIVIGSPTANRNHHQIEPLIGFFVNTLAIRIDLSGDPTVRQLLERVRMTCLDAQNYQDLPFEQVVDIVQPPRNLSHTPLFQVMFVLQNNEMSQWDLPGLETVDIDPSYDIAKFDMALVLFESESEIIGSMSYSTALFDSTTMERHVGYLYSVLRAMIGAVDQPLSSVGLLSQVERNFVLGEWNETQQDYPADLCIHHLFEQQVERTPHATALVFNEESMTYTELNDRANRLAHHLIELGVQPDSLVAICVERSFAMIIGVIAVLKAGGAYIPLDPSYPKDRLAYILEDAVPTVALVDSVGRATLSETSQHPHKKVDLNVHLPSSVENAEALGLTSRHMAYIMYTSGSTGRPKGVMIEHQGVVNFALARINDYGLDASSRMLQFSSLNFDLSVMEMFTAFYSGASLHLLEDRIRLDRQELWRYIEQNAITQAILPPAILQECKNCPPLSTRLTLVSCGEELPATLLQALQPLIPNGSIINEYGPSETAIGDIAWRSPKRFDDDVVPIGRPIGNKKIYILDRHGQPVPTGSIGELYIGGVGVARGYLNRPDLTSKAFHLDPFADDKDARMYKTGDLARYRTDGNIIFLGRNDHQVKIRGFRIELGEIEAQLVGHPLVDKAAVITVGEGSDKRLVGYVVAKSDGNLLNSLRSHLTSCLPEYMIPAAIVRLDSLPLNSNGKLDRKALPVPDSDAFARQIYEEPKGEVETAIAHIWAKVLNLDRVSRNDNFFALGGHSLLAVRLMNRVASLGVPMSLSTIFAYPTLSSFAESVSQCMDKEATMYSTIHPISREGDLPLSFSQQRMWFLAQMEGVSETYHMSMAVRLHGDLNRDAWQRALDTVFARHEALRSVFVVNDGQPQVRLLSPQSGMPIRWKDLRGSSDVESQFERMSIKEARDPFDLAKGPLIRVLMVQLDTNEYVCMVTQHHIVTDGWSSAIFTRELNTLYSSYCNGKSDPLFPLSIQYPDYAAWQRQCLSGDRLETHTTYWKASLADAPVLLDLPTDRPRPPQQSYAGDNIHIRWDSDLTRALHQLCKEHGVTLYMAILAAWSCVLSRMSGQDDIIIGSPSANRNHRQIESLIGFFVNTLALRIDLAGDPTVHQLLERVRKVSLDAQNHQDLPFEQIVDIVQPPRNLSHSPLFQVMLVLQNNETSEWHLPGLDVVETDSSSDIAKFDLTLSLFESDNEILGALSYSTALFDRTTVERHVGYLHSMLQAMVTDLDRPVMSVDLLSPVERDLVLGEWNNTRQDYPADLCIHHLFEQQAERTPQATALVFNDHSLTYAELNKRANRLAHHLIELGVRPECLVAICVERSIGMIVGVLAILKAGGAYIPLDPAYASERLRDILIDASPNIVIVDAVGRTTLGETVSSMTMVDPDGLEDTGQQQERSRVESPASSQLTHNPHVPGLTSSHLAYIIYTSGSTGRPKGVMIEHRGVVNLIHGRPESFGISNSSHALLFTSLSFDHSVSEIFSALTAGACLHLVQDEIRLDRLRLWEYFEQHSISHTSITPTLLQDIKDLSPLTTPLTFVIMGETLPSSLIPQVQKVVPNGKIINEYGPTETTVATTIWKCPHNFNGDIVSIGRPIPNKTMYILDKNQQPVPIGAVGELYIGGVGVARGYLSRPELTTKMFLPDPFAGDEGARMYKTGDQVRYLTDGNIIFIGRNDHQVKIRGFRIELGEIEARLSEQPLVQSVAVVATGEGADKRLIAYVVARYDDQLVHILRSRLTSCLPEYMIPAAIVRLDSLPLNSNGKLDRKALPVPDSDAFARQIYEEPKGEVETAIAHIWAKVLNLDRVSRNDNFFALGGHSLLAVRLMNRVASLGVPMSLSTIFAYPTLSSFAESVSQCMDKEATMYSTIHPISREGDLPLSFSQQRMWFLAQMEGVSETYHMSMAVRLHGDLNRDAWQRALDTVFARHEALRSVFVVNDGQPQVRLLPAQSGMPIRWKDLRGSSDVESLLERMSIKEARDPFDLAKGPLIRVLMVQLDTNEYVCMVTQHHIVSDGWSSAIFNRELSTLYSAYCDGKSDPLPPLSIQYPDYAAWQKQWFSGKRLETHATYWKTALSDAPVLLNLPTDRPRPLEQSFTGDNIPIHLDSHLTRSLKQLCQQHGVTLYMAVLAAWSCVLSRMSGQEDIVIGSPSANRNHHQIEPLIGFFINTLALRIDLSGGPTLCQLLERVRKTSIDAQDHQDLPFEQVVDIVQPPRSLSHSPLFQVMFVLQNNETSEWNLPGLEVADADASYNIAKFDLTLGLYESDNEIMGGMSYSTVLFDHATVERHVGYLCSMLQSMVGDLDRPAMSVDLLSETERDLVLGQWNETQQDYPTDLCIHHLFEQQVERTPQATALVFNGQSITYAELNERANRLAHHLIGLGVQPDSLVAICLERSFAMVVGVLAVLKAGGAYVPLDASYPKERLAYILEDVSPAIALADTVGGTALSEASQHLQHQKGVPSMINPNDHLPTSTVNPEVRALTSCHLAYIIYTSGSTGQPKGVMVEHRGVVNYALSRINEFNLDANSRVLQFASLSFDMSLIDIFTALYSGASLHLLEDHIRLDRDELWRYIQEHSITQAVLPPAILQECKNCPPLSTRLTLVCAGEELSATLLHALQSLIPNGCVMNEYGPTEATIVSTNWKSSREFKGDFVPIGRPIANKRVYILDEHRQPVPLGVIGELYIGGVGIARGYLNRPELTAKVFLPDPFARDKGARMYKTGDLAQYLPDGNILFLGRNDQQVKIRGFRIELGEIEARLLDHPLVQSAAVMAMGDGSEKRLVAYVVAERDDDLVNTLRSHLTSCLPDYMVPAAFVRLDDLPLSSNGKLDRRRLPQPDSDAMAYQRYEPPHGDMETALMTIWINILNIDKIGRHDNFFMLGGHSLLAVRMISQVQSLMGYRITLGTLFMAPTIAELVPHMLTSGNTQEDAFDVLLPIRPRGTRHPLFCVHHGGGLSWSYIGLSRHLHPDQPIFGLQARGFFEGGESATTLDDMALDYMEQIRRIQPHGPYCLLGYSFGGVVVHTMAAQLESQGERVALLAVMDTVPRNSTTKSQAAIERQNSEAHKEIDLIQLFTNRVESALPDRARSYLERLPHVVRHLTEVFRSHTSPHCKSGMVLFRAMVQKDPSRQPISPDVWRPHVMGEIDVFDIDCEHIYMDQPAPLAEIGGVLAQRLNGIHATEAKEL
ncbi:MAG: Non-ribosomal peptide synthetase module [Benniella sp.]|nr:MAG: Non-ribosomal peptide synthetase module [Benniella sp.]